MSWGRNWVQKGQRKTQRMTMMSAATMIGITVDEYARHLEADERWCSYHKAWEAKSGFAPEPSRITGTRPTCRSGESARSRNRYLAKKQAASEVA